MYKSSPVLTFIFKYIHPTIMLIGGGLGIYFMSYSDDVMLKSFLKAFCVAFVYLSFFLIQIFFRLKNIEVDNDGVKIGIGENREYINFEDIIYISKFDIVAPMFITLKFRDKKKNTTRKIAFLPLSNANISFGDDDITRFIKSKMKLHIPNYTESRHPSTIRNFGKLMLIGLPFIALMIYFLKDFNV